MRQRNTAPVLTSNLPASTRKAPAPMINFFRSFFQSKIGLGLTIGFLVLIAIAFAAGDVGNSGSFGGLSGTNSVAVVGDEDVTTAELRQSADNAFRQVQQDEPTLSMAEFVEDGGLMQVLDTLLDRVAVSEFGRLVGLRAGENLINSEIMQLPDTDEIVMLAGAHPIRAKKARYYADPRLAKRVEPPPMAEQSPSQPDAGEWEGVIARAPKQPLVASDPAEPEDRDAVADGGVRREPELPQHEDIAPAPSPPRNSRRIVGHRYADRPRTSRGWPATQIATRHLSIECGVPGGPQPPRPA